MIATWLTEQSKCWAILGSCDGIEFDGYIVAVRNTVEKSKGDAGIYHAGRQTKDE